MIRRRVAIGTACVVPVWLVVLLVLDLALGESHGQGVADRIAEALQGTGSLGDSDLALVRGRLQLADMRVRRDDAVGKLTLDVGDIRCELRPLGMALIDRDCRELAIGGLRLDASSLALFRVDRPRRPPIEADTMTIEDAELTLALPPPLFGTVKIAIDRAIAGTTTFRTPLSWVFALRSLDAHVALPLGRLDVVVRSGLVIVRGELFGAERLSICPLVPPAQHPDDDARAEIARLTAFGKQLGDQIFGGCQLLPVATP